METVNKTDIIQKRYLSPAEAMIYTGLSRGALTQLSEKAEARKHVGRRVLIDRLKLDAYLETLTEAITKEAK